MSKNPKLNMSCLLSKAKLSSYTDSFNSIGADDPEQLAMMSKDEFDNLLKSVGMISKPLHVERLLKVLTELFNVAPNYDPPDIPPKTDLMYQYQPQFTTSGGSSLFQDSNLSSKRKRKKSFYGELILPSNATFDDLIEKRSNTETRDLITELSVIYTKKPLSQYHLYINACAAQLCMRDTTLLARREKLLELARQALVTGGHYKFKRGFSIAKNAPKVEDSKRPTKFMLASQNREKRLKEMKELEEKIERLHYDKRNLMLQLQHESERDSTVAVGVVRSKLDSIEEQIYVANSKLRKVSLSQKKSERYYVGKIGAHDAVKSKKSEESRDVPTTVATTKSNPPVATFAPVQIVNTVQPSSNKPPILLIRNNKPAPYTPCITQTSDSFHSTPGKYVDLAPEQADKSNILNDVFTTTLSSDQNLETDQNFDFE